MSGPRIDIPPTRREWHRVAELAMADLRADPTNVEAQEALGGALAGIKAWATDDERRAADDVRGYHDEARQVSPPVSAGMGIAKGMSFGFGDEAAGLVTALGRILPGGESPRNAYYRGRDANRAFDAQAEASNPAVYFGGDMAGTFAPGLAAGLVKSTVPRILRVVPSAARPALLAASELGASTAAKAAGVGAAMRSAARYGFAHGYGRAEDGPVADLVPAAASAVASGLLAAPLAILARRNLASSGLTSMKEREQVARTLTAEETARRAPYTTTAASERATQAPMQTDIVAQRLENMQQASPRPMLGPELRPQGVASDPRVVQLMRATGVTEEQAVAILAGRTPHGNAPTSRAPTPQVMDRPMPPVLTTRPAVAVPQEVVAQTPMPSALPSENVPPILRPSPQRVARDAVRSAAREAYVAAEAAAPGTGKEAARRAAAMANEAAAPTEASLPNLEAALARSVELETLLRGGPTREAMQRLQTLAANLPRGEYEALNRRVLSLPAWRSALTGVR